MKKINTLLIVDDDDDDRDLFCEAVGKVSSITKCIHAMNGLDALEMLQKNTPILPDLIFLDLNMPKLNGRECLIQLRQLDGIKNIPIFIYSTSNCKRDKEETKNLGASGFILKPTNLDSLCKEIFADFSI